MIPLLKIGSALIMVSPSSKFNSAMYLLNAVCLTFSLMLFAVLFNTVSTKRKCCYVSIVSGRGMSVCCWTTACIVTGNLLMFCLKHLFSENYNTSIQLNYSRDEVQHISETRNDLFLKENQQVLVKRVLSTLFKILNNSTVYLLRHKGLSYVPVKQSYTAWVTCLWRQG